MIPVANKLDVGVFGGPSIFMVGQDTITSLTVTEPGPTVNAPLDRGQEDDRRHQLRRGRAVPGREQRRRRRARALQLGFGRHRGRDREAHRRWLPARRRRALSVQVVGRR